MNICKRIIDNTIVSKVRYESFKPSKEGKKAMSATDVCIAVQRAATCDELQAEAARLTAVDLQRVLPIHPDHLHRTHLGYISEEGFRLHCLYRQRVQLRASCNNSPEQAQERERLWQEMTRLKILLNGYLETEIQNFSKHPMDLVFVDSNRAVYALFGEWEPIAEDPPEDLALVDLVIERYGAGDPMCPDNPLAS